ncbi:MAG: hypothetical protein IJC38_08280 [Erysipelotrichaceae bacterium]|nr:hypothetical protein [Erysipelotrichaceae bacterium]
MQKKSKTVFTLFLATILLFSGLFISGIGETFCRYVIEHQSDVTFEVRTAGTYYVNTLSEWDYEPSEDVYTLSFDVTNSRSKTTPPANEQSFFLRWNATTQGQYTLVVIDASGMKTRYESVLVSTYLPYYEYRFYDENNREVMLHLPGNQYSKQMFKMEAQKIDDDLLAKALILDASYEVEVSKGYLIAEYYPLSVSSNTLKESEEVTYVMDETAEITMLSNQNASSKVSVTVSDDTISATLSKKNVDLELGKEASVTLTLVSNIIEEEINEEEQNTEESVNDTQEPVQLLLAEEETQELPIQTFTLEETPESTPTLEPTETPVATPTPEPTVEPTETPESTETPEPTETPVVTPTPESTVEPTETPESTETPEPTRTPEMTPTPTPEPTPTAKPEIELGYATVTWQILDEEGKTIKELKAHFKLKESIKQTSETPVVQMVALNEASFSHKEPVKLEITSDLDTCVELKEPLFKPNTHYSLDQGETWLTLLKEDSILIPLKQYNKQPVWIDYCDTEKLSNEEVTFKLFLNETELTQLSLMQSSESLPVLTVSEVSTGIINYQPITFKVNVEDLQFTVQRKYDNAYYDISWNALFDLSTDDSLSYTLSIKENVNVSEGNYRLIVQKTAENQNISQEVIPFFAIEDEGGTEA